MHHAYIIPITHSNAHARCLGACPVWEEGLTLTPSFRDKGKKEWGVIYTGDGKERGREKEMVAYSESCRSPGPSSAQMDSIFYTRVGACCATFAACLASLVIICYFVCLRRTWNTFVHRLKLQLTAVALVVSVLYLIQVLPMKLDNRSPRAEDSATPTLRPNGAVLVGSSSSSYSTGTG